MTPTSTAALAVLLVEDDPADARFVREILQDAAPRPVAVTHAVRLHEALRHLETRGFSVVLLDLSLPDSQGLATFTRARATAPDAPIVVLTGLSDEKVAATAVREGAQDYLVKGTIDGRELYRAIRYAVERHAAAEALRGSEARYRGLVEGSIQGVVIHEDDVIVLANPALAALLGETRPEAMIDTSIWSFIDPADRDRVASYTEARLSGRSAPHDYEFRAIRRDGTHVWLNCLETTIPWNGRPAILKTLVDITVRKEAEQNLRDSEERFRQLADNVKEAFIVTELPSYRTLYLSDVWEDIWGLPVEDVYRDPRVWFEAIHPDDRASVRAGQDALLRGEPATDVFRVIRPDRTQRWVRARTFPVFDEAGRPYRIVGLAEDITGVRETEDQLRQAQKMEAVGLLAGGVAHDFNNLLMAMMGYAELAIADLGPDHASTRDLIEIRTAAESAGNLTRQLLAFSRRQILQPRDIGLNDVIGRLQAIVRRVLREDIEVELALSATLPLVNADPGQIEQVLMNLVVNARDAMPDGGRITIETRAVDLDDTFVAHHRGAAIGPHAMLAVSDTGTGMDAATQKRLFEPFFTTKEMGKGTGLGLATVYGIVKQSRGSIWVYSEVGAGSTFKIYLPVVAGTTAASRVDAREPASLAGTETILLVEDQVDARGAIAAILRRHGYTVLEATGGAEAVAKAKDHAAPIHLMLTDIVMPRGGGRDAAGAVCASRPELLVIFMSGYADDAVVRHGVLEPGLVFIQKPFSADALLRKVREVLTSRSGA